MTVELADTDTVVPEMSLVEANDGAEPTLAAGLSFGSVADLYDAVRPDYPERLIDAILEHAQLPAQARALEIGAGTGQATAQFAWRGLRIHALEPSQEMVDLMVSRFDGTDLEVTFAATTLEAAELEPAAYDLVYCATAWHWLEPGRRWEIVEEAMRPGATLAVLYHVPRWWDTALRPALDDLYRKAGAPLEQMGPVVSSMPTIQAFATDWVADAPNPERFDEVRAVGLNWSVGLPAEEYVDLLGTYGDHIALDPTVRQRLFADIVELIDDAGGLIELKYSTVLLLTRLRGEAA